MTIKKIFALLLILVLIGSMGTMAFATEVVPNISIGPGSEEVVPEPEATPAPTPTPAALVGGPLDGGTVTPPTATPAPTAAPSGAGTTGTTEEESIFRPDVNAPIAITKHPGAEPPLNPGQSVEYTAKATNADTVCWYVTNGATTYPAEAISIHFPGMSCKGFATAEMLNDVTCKGDLIIFNVTTSFDGWKAYAVFTNSKVSTITPASTSTVTITVNGAAATPTPTVAPTPTPAPTPSPTPVPTVAPTATPAPTPVPTPEPTPVITMAPAVTAAVQAASSSVLPFILIAICGIIIVTAAVVAILYSTNVISLDWLERLVEKKDRYDD